MSEAPAGSLETALEHAARLLRRDPALAARQAIEILKVMPDEPRAKLLLATAQRRQGDAPGALAVLEPLARAQPRAAQVCQELGLTLAVLGQTEPALGALRRAVELKPALPEAWRAMGDLAFAQGDRAAADAAYGAMVGASVADPDLMAASSDLGKDRIAVAEGKLREHLARAPTDVAAMRLLAEALTRLGRYGEAESLLEGCLGRHPSFDGARYNLAIVLYRQQRGAEALPHLERLLAADPKEPAYRNLMAACLGLVGEYERAMAIYDDLLSRNPDQPKMWLSYGHALKTAGRTGEAVSAYHRCLALAPSLGEAWWSLANLKTVAFSAEDAAAMGAELARAGGEDEDRLHLHYAMGKALEDRGDYASAFSHYASGAAIRRRMRPYDAEAAHGQMLRAKTLFTPQFFAERAGAGSPAADPIFVVGLPRAGSTLIEQILASHSAVEGAMELPDIGFLARRLGGAGGEGYPEALAQLDPAALTALGEEYLVRTRIHRKLGRPRFIDKMPNNFHHLGLIALILPRAKIIDARRGAMASCFSAFKQHFARGQGFSYDLSDLGRYYRDYVEVMAHFEATLPGAILRVRYEDVVEDLEGEVRRMLDFLGLPFEAPCLEFHRNARAVRTASSEQVRRPIFREGLDQWRRFEPWLEPLKTALGPELAGR